MKNRGIIVKALSGFYYVDTGETVITCRARGKHRYGQFTPLVGDSVAFTLTSEGEGALDDFADRKNAFTRPAVANLDQLVLIVSEAVPKTDPFLIDRMTSRAANENCAVVIAVNKCDLASGEALYQIYQKAGFPTVRTSAVTGEGIPQLKDWMKDKVSAFTGNSGVGKSSLLNALDPNRDLATGEISEKLGRGRHTTRHVELFSLPEGGYVMDTPGFASFEDDIMVQDYLQRLPRSFVDFHPYLSQCQFADCSHTKEKGCGVLEALTEGKIQPSRHQSYLQMYAQGAEISQWERTQYHKKKEMPKKDGNDLNAQRKPRKR